ncbi:DUF4435 domain-containing protein [Pectobacterium jejuense]|uniref:DUF4435 domain-containing protein n=1 Tax=Pectobacterium jejuense TaxID=2974022 RepID=UPI003801AAA7
MEQYITSYRVANAIMQDKSFKGIHILVEGVKDLKVYTKFFNRTEVRLTQTGGKYNQRDAYYTLSARGFTNAIAIRDADFIRIKGNLKFDENFQDNIFITDGHDSEMMMIMVDTLEDVLAVSVDQDAKNSFEGSVKCSIRKLVLNIAYTVGCLRLAEKKNGFGLSFKPERPEGNRIKFKKFIDDKTFLPNVNQMIHTIWEYSKNRGKVVSSKEVIAEGFNKIFHQNNPLEDIINGHDVAEIICIVLSQGLKSKSSIFQHPNNVEESLALSFDRNKFRRTNLYRDILKWQGQRGGCDLFSDK